MQTLDLEGAAKYLHCHEDTVRELAASGRLPGAKVGRAWVFVDVDLIEWLRAQYTACRSTKSVQSGTTTSPLTENGIGNPLVKRTSVGHRKYTTGLNTSYKDKEHLTDLL